MSYNSFGTHFRMTSYGESHGKGIGVVIDGCPAGLAIDPSHIQYELNRRRPGQSKWTTERNEADLFELQSGLVDNITTGAPIHIFIPNTNQKPKDYNNLQDVYRPSHADYTYQQKYGLRDHRGGGRSSARETACRVAAGAIAKQFLALSGIKIIAYANQIGKIKCPDPVKSPSIEEIENSRLRCPFPDQETQMKAALSMAMEAGDTLGGCITCIIEGHDVGLGSPIYDKLNARLAYSIMSINAVKGIEFGLGFDSASMSGSEQNDNFITDDNGDIKTSTNHSGGIQGGISNGMPIKFRVAFKAISSIKMTQNTVDINKKEKQINIEGRHDPCVVPRAVPIVEAMAALVLMDAVLARRLDQV